MLAAAAVPCAVVWLLWPVAEDGEVLLPVLLAAPSLLLLLPWRARTEEGFADRCWTVGWLLAGAGVLGAPFGLFLLFPAGSVLLAAGFRARPESGRLPGVLGWAAAAFFLLLGTYLLYACLTDPYRGLEEAREAGPALGLAT
ncbi:hypothetical protein Kpho02_71500 [Kitasatospora phosalacinea]|uniref:Uncharacterized protein n=2 Tax=Kitasatospora phosalacinea TaxID=2065 RepID=A0A9W6V616_9ACTN|nr:hypothetical protein Kpho02_71500 [Kitasatospora phosalacinea]